MPSRRTSASAREVRDALECGRSFSPRDSLKVRSAAKLELLAIVERVGVPEPRAAGSSG